MTERGGKVVRLSVQVVPNAPKNQIVGWHGEALKVKVAAVPEDGKANKELAKFLAKELGVAKGAVRLVAGAKSRKKVVELEGMTGEELESRLMNSDC